MLVVSDIGAGDCTTNAPPQAAPQASGVTDEQLMQQVQSDVQSALKGGQWLLSCYAPYKEKPVFPGIPDLSPEEARLFIYEAKSNNNVEQAVAYMDNLTKEQKSKYEQLLTTNSPDIIKVLRSLYKGEASSSPFNGQTPNTFASQSNPSSIFRGAIQNQNIPFAQNAQSIFAQANKSVFNQVGQDTAKSIFSQASQNVFGSQPSQNAFGSQPSQNFGSQPAQNQSPFGAPDAAKSIFAQANTSPFESAPPTFKSPFEQPSPFAQNTGNVFQKSEPSSVFGQAAFQSTPVDDPGVYSNMNDLSEDDVQKFKADSFTLGFIPEIPPPHSLCI
ncbi:hypothetical protein MSG28_012943 [Choristoneura fumiferana]|uniref:Uncharacterized protein n=1 Tax=Choristoneura fumiferana TaxID=7141 RepID=A0ACC0KRG0_CHOFU|nr:hypothetical protein MSG28_012943 [Choristoneura fumiferana]